MLAVLKKTAAPGIVLEEVPPPTPKASEVLVKIYYSSICGTDVGIYDWGTWAQAHVKPPRILGHELVGEILAVPSEENNPSGLKVGDIVSSETHIFCGECHQCKMGNRHICEQMTLFGIERDGGFAHFATIPARTAWKNDSRVPLPWMSVQEPLGNAVHVVTKAAVSGKDVIVFGLGPVGLCAGQVAKVMGAGKIVAIDPSPYRQKLAEQFGFSEARSTFPSEWTDQFDVSLEMSGSQGGIDNSGLAIRPGGTIMAFGIPKEKITLDWGKFLIDKEVTIESVFGRRIWETWEKTTELLTLGKVSLGPLITHEFPLEQFEEAMQIMKSGKCGKVLIKVG